MRNWFLLRCNYKMRNIRFNPKRYLLDKINEIYLIEIMIAIALVGTVIVGTVLYFVLVFTGRMKLEG